MTVEMRLEKLERSTRIWKTSAIVLLGGLLFLGADRERHQPVTTTELNIVNEAGDTVAVFDEYSDRGRVRIWNEEGDLSLVLGATSKFGGVVMAYQPGGENTGVVLYGYMDPKKSGQVVINDSKGKAHWWAPQE